MASFANIGTLFCSLILLLVFTADNSGVIACSGGGGDSAKTTGCKYGEFHCNDNSGCYTEAQKCDKTDHCHDKSDEDSHHCGKMTPIRLKLIANSIYRCVYALN